jgi:glutamate-5-semialdehyde dehydrogenase
MIQNLYMEKIGENAVNSLKQISNLNIKKKNSVLKLFSSLLKKYSKSILKANKLDLLNVRKNKNYNTSRLSLNEEKINKIRKSLSEIIKFKDPLGKTLMSWKRPNGIMIKKISIPLGVIGVIYESRPNVTADVAALCFKTGNPVILRGGSEAYYSNKIISNLFRKALIKKKCNKNFVQFITDQNRKNVDYLLSKMNKYIDVVVPRGGKGLVKKVQRKSKVPVIGHLEGICHVYVDSDANIDMSIKIVKNAKMRNYSICGAAETLLIDSKCLITHCKPILEELSKSGCEIIGDKIIKKYFKNKIKIASENDWSTEYLSPKISVKIVDGVKEAINHINKYGTSHTDAIITKNKKTAKTFLLNVKSAIAIHNASTQFADGGEFGFGAEIGISTERLHPRGPVGLDQITTYKYILYGKGQIRK